MENPTPSGHYKRVSPLAQAVPYPVIEQTASLYTNPKDRLLFAWLYLTGQRVSEALQVRRQDVTLDEGEGQPYFVVDSITLKNPLQPRRKIPVPLSGFESQLSNFVWNAIKDLKPEVRLHYYTRQTAFNRLTKVAIPREFVTSDTKQRYTAKIAINPHYLRHCRATHLVDLHSYEKGRLERFMGWASDKMANTYVIMDWRNLASGFRRNSIG